MSAISHITLGTNDTERAGRFYDTVLGVLGFQRLLKPPSKPPAYEKGGLPTISLPTRGWTPCHVGQWHPRGCCG